MHTEWTGYLRTYHDQRPGITEQAFDLVRDQHLGSPYDWLVGALSDRPGKVLDVASGSAPLHPRLTTASSYLGVDVSEAELTLARDRGRGPVERADALDLPLADRSVDTVVSSMGLMLVQPLHVAVHEVARVLRPGGTAAFLLPSRSPLRSRDVVPLAVLSRHLHGVGSMPQQVHRRRLTRLVERAGLKVARTGRHRFRFPVHCAEHAQLAVRALYTPGRTPHQLQAAEAALTRMARPGLHLALPLLLFVARKPG